MLPDVFRVWGLLGGSVVEKLPTNAGDTGSIPGLKRSPGEGNGNPILYSCLGNPIDRILVGYNPGAGRRVTKELDMT